MYPAKRNAESVDCMEDILNVYEMYYNLCIPVVCMDEKTYQLLGGAKETLSMRSEDAQKIDSEYARNGTASIYVIDNLNTHAVAYFTKHFWPARRDGSPEHWKSTILLNKKHYSLNITYK